ncbi:hypothetical protein L2747_09895 [Shewanella marinintestina]|uniref:hypothetical protein n=1 Tax=Shewanella marinintestina TaxID=190305 RepID=UPI00200F8A91|nr:hypothetical protein [Shewanella marinintestina]MCL1146307.1 hypothetical protein [Shewanella marinintestina]
MKKLFSMLALTLALTACGSDDDDTPSVDIDSATVLKVTQIEFDNASHTFTFSLNDGAGLPVTGAENAKYKMMYLGHTPATVTAFSVPWHHAVLCSAGFEVEGSCMGELKEKSLGNYSFTPDTVPTETWQNKRLAITIAGALRQNKAEVIIIDSNAS